MIFKFVIIGVILLGGGILFSNEISQFLPETSANLINSAKNDFNKIKDDTIQETETRVEGAIITVEGEVNDIKDSTQQGIKEITDSTQKGISKVAGSTQQGIKEIADSTQEEIFGDDDNDQNTNDNPRRKNGSSSSQSSNNNVISFETLSLTTTQQSDNSVMLQYEDTSGKTISVSVILRTTENEIFSGIFYSSMFETYVNDISDIPYFIDMIVVHEEYGTITSSVYNPVDSPNTMINGVFSSS